MTDHITFSSASGLSAADSTWMAHLHRGPQVAGGRQPPVASPARSAASLATAVHQLLEGMTGRRVPRLEGLRRRLHDIESACDLAPLDQALHALHLATGAIDFLAARGGPSHAAGLRSQGAAVGAAAVQLGSVCLAFVGRHAADGAMARLLWIDLQLEYRALDRRVRKGLQWLVDMEHEVHARRAATTAEVSQRALDELGRRGQALEDRLHLVHGLCGSARVARALGEQVDAQRSALCLTLQDRVRPCTLGLQQRLQPLLDAVAARPLEPPELLAAIDARHELQVALTQAGADLQHLQSMQDELATQLGWMERKAGRIA